jgi:hypothetical protein
LERLKSYTAPKSDIRVGDGVALLKRFAPPGTQAALFIDVAHARRSPLVQKCIGKCSETLSGTLGADDAVKQWLADADVDWKKDLDEILVAVTGLPTDPSVLVVVRGGFDGRRLVAAVEKALDGKFAARWRVLVEDGKPLVELKGPNGQILYGAPLASGTFGLSMKKETLLAAAKDDGTQRLSTELLVCLDKVRATDEGWFALATDEKCRGSLQVNPYLKDFASVLSVTGSLSVLNDPRVELLIETADRKTAGQIKTQLDQFKKLGALMVQGNPDVGPAAQELLDNLKITTDDKTVKVTLTVTEQVIDKWMEK